MECSSLSQENVYIVNCYQLYYFNTICFLDFGLEEVRASPKEGFVRKKILLGHISFFYNMYILYICNISSVCFFIVWGITIIFMSIH